jgi:acetate CoA/acetoacetate CoA-transferase beta subunit
LPLTSTRAVDLIVTELAVIGFRNGRATLLERGPRVRVEGVVAATEAKLDIPQRVPEMAVSDDAQRPALLSKTA